MHILPTHDPRRPSSNDQDPSKHNNRATNTPHYHYHAAGDAEERIRRINSLTKFYCAMRVDADGGTLLRYLAQSEFC